MTRKRMIALTVILILAAVVLYYAVPRTFDAQDYHAVSYTAETDAVDLSTDPVTDRTIMDALDGCTYRPRFPLFADRDPFDSADTLMLTIEGAKGTYHLYLCGGNRTSVADRAPDGKQYSIADGDTLRAKLLDILEK